MTKIFDCVVASVCIGALTSFGLSFTNLSPLVIGGIVGAASPALLMTLITVGAVYSLYKEGKFRCSRELFFLGCAVAASAAVSVGLATAADAYGITTGTVLAGTAIGALSPVIGLFGILAVFIVADKINEHIISPTNTHIIYPTIEKVQEYFLL